MRILHLTDHYLPALGGIETHVQALASRQAARGDDVTVLTSTPGEADGRSSDDVGPVTVLRARSVLDAGPLPDVDVVHAHVSVAAAFASPMAALAARRGAPTVVTVHSLWDGLGPLPAAAAAVTGLRGAPVLWTAVSRVAAEQLGRRLPGERYVPVLPNAVDVGPREPRPAESSGPVRLVSTMRIARRKRPLALLEMFAELRRCTSGPVHLTLVGDGPLRPRVERRLRRAGLQGSVSITGRLEPDEVLRTLAAADVYVAPAVLESFGLAALEARCVGLPVVGHAASGLREFVRDGVEGWLVGSDAEMVERLRVLVDDAPLRRRVAKHNRTVPSGLTWDSALAANDAAYALVRSGVSRLAGPVPASPTPTA